MPTIHLNSITTYSISFQLENDIRKKALSEEEIAHVYELFKEKKQKQFTSVKIMIIVMAVFALIIGIATLLKMESFDSDERLLSFIGIALAFVIMGIAGYLGWYCNIGKISKQWNKLLKDYYPQISEKYKL